MDKKELQYIAVVISMSFVVIIFLIFMFWWVYPYKTVEVKSQPYIVEQSPVKQGENLIYVVDYCKYTKVVPIVHKQFIDGIIYSVPESNVNLPIGCQKIRVSVRVPENLPPDANYRLKVHTAFQVNPIRIITNEYETEEFSVIK